MFSCSSSCQPRGEPYFFMFLALAVALTQLVLWSLTLEHLTAPTEVVVKAEQVRMEATKRAHFLT